MAVKLNEHGFRVYATVTDIKGEGVQYMRDNCRFEDRLAVKQLDVTNDAEVSQLAKEVGAELEANGELLWSVVNGAEVREFGHSDWSEFAMFEKIFAVNTLGTVRVVRAFLPLLRLSKGMCFGSRLHFKKLRSSLSNLMKQAVNPPFTDSPFYSA